jgi:chloramphenicol 3-O phosphotransferase
MILVLNGPSSAGKTTLANRVRELRGPTCAVVSIDQLWACLHRDAPRGWTTFAALTETAFAGAAALASGGFDVIVDTVFERPASLATARRVLAAHRYQLVAVTCPLDVLEVRETARGDRRAGQARDQHARVFHDAVYDLTLDTGATAIDECATRCVALFG